MRCGGRGTAGSLWTDGDGDKGKELRLTVQYLFTARATSSSRALRFVSLSADPGRTVRDEVACPTLLAWCARVQAFQVSQPLHVLPTTQSLCAQPPGIVSTLFSHLRASAALSRKPHHRASMGSHTRARRKGRTLISSQNTGNGLALLLYCSVPLPTPVLFI